MRDEPVRRHMAAEGIDGTLPPTAFSHTPIVELGLLLSVESAIIKRLNVEVRDGDD